MDTVVWGGGSNFPSHSHSDFSTWDLGLSLARQKEGALAALSSFLLTPREWVWLLPVR